VLLIVTQLYVRLRKPKALATANVQLKTT